MKLLGKIVRLQIQRDCLKRIEAGKKRYDPSPIHAVSELTLTRTGAWVRAPDGSFTIDVHNAAHPSTRNNNGVNPFSFVFTSHYEAMQSKFGSHVVTGCAGESILIESAQRITLADVAAGVVIQTQRGPVALGNVVVAAPCASFSHFALQDMDASPEVLKSTLQFLDDGVRGFYCQLASEGPATIAIGDSVFAATK